MTKGYAETVADNLINGWIEFGWIDQKHARSLKASMIHHLADKDSVQPDAAPDWRDRFWQIVDGKGLLGLPSDEWNALSRLVDRYAATQPDAVGVGEIERLAAWLFDYAKADYEEHCNTGTIPIHWQSLEDSELYRSAAALRALPAPMSGEAK